MIKNFTASHNLLQKALKIIPLASQTFSKSHIQYPEGFSPLFIKNAEGARVTDIDGNRFIDLVSGLMSNVLGYNDLEINEAICNQLKKGISFSLPSELEYELASLLLEIIPSAEMVRFGKTGTDATSAAIRLARAYTKRDKIIACGYHGWQDWYIGSTSRNLGVPRVISELTSLIPYNDLNIIEKKLRTEEYAALIMEPTNINPPKLGYLESVRSLTHKYNTVLVFDEIVTGLHFALGGAQEYFNITPDLSCFGKGLGNGMPISAIVGKVEIMKLMDDIFFSGTFGGETLSLAAGIAVIKKMQQEPVIKHLWEFGQKLADGVQSVVDYYNLSTAIKLNGYAPWKILSFHDFNSFSSQSIKTFFQKKMIESGVLILGSHNISYAMKDAEFDEIITAYDKTCNALKISLDKGTLLSDLQCPVIQPIFKVR